jgi:NTP pyrophosphatase (non-canonical NTP hydrolase)
MTDLEYVLARVPLSELLAQTAEEAIELAHAALKLRRTLDSYSPTPLATVEAVVQFEEEIADLTLCQGICLGQLGYNGEKTLVIQDLMDYKLKRWADRLRAQEEETDGP